ncbi:MULTISPECIES: hypothetical protein [unclassified Streptomyces]|uniref:hypothetical protein n=1 Tax=unclassified Streptomyces TaxID=2593676 RepID=UPI000939EDD8|nr:hypothetical protein [Streptomyces sp. TSRI0281]OKI34990.1 hypothetical protein A6A29_16325 [Streptomyces sp. TSRI0281]
MDQAPEQQPRIEGVKYRKVTRSRPVTTVIDGIPSTRNEEYEGWEPVPPREWDELILRGVTGIAVSFTAIAVIGGTASLGGLLGPLVPTVIAYGMGSVFAVAWMFCLAIEWLNRTAPDRARPAKIAGWFFLFLSMGAIATYGNTLNHSWAGVFGGFVDLVAKGSWWLLLREYAVPLDAGVAHWVDEQEQKLAGRALLAGRVRRLNRRAAYQRAVGGAEFQAADAILGRAEAARQLPQAAAEPAPVPAPAPAPATATAVVIPPEPPVPPATPAPVAPRSQPESSVPSAPPVPPGAPRDEVDEQQEEPAVEPVAQITRPGIAAICRKGIAADAKVTDAALLAAVLAAGHPAKQNLSDTVRRSALRIDPNRRAS